MRATFLPSLPLKYHRVFSQNSFLAVEKTGVMAVYFSRSLPVFISKFCLHFSFSGISMTTVRYFMLKPKWQAMKIEGVRKTKFFMPDFDLVIGGTQRIFSSLEVLLAGKWV